MVDKPLSEKHKQAIIKYSLSRMENKLITIEESLITTKTQVLNLTDAYKRIETKLDKVLDRDRTDVQRLSKLESKIKGLTLMVTAVGAAILGLIGSAVVF